MAAKADQQRTTGAVLGQSASKPADGPGSIGLADLAPDERRLTEAIFSGAIDSAAARIGLVAAEWLAAAALPRAVAGVRAGDIAALAQPLLAGAASPTPADLVALLGRGGAAPVVERLLALAAECLRDVVAGWPEVTAALADDLLRRVGAPPPAGAPRSRAAA